MTLSLPCSIGIGVLCESILCQTRHSSRDILNAEGGMGVVVWDFNDLAGVRKAGGHISGHLLEQVHHYSIISSTVGKSRQIDISYLCQLNSSVSLSRKQR